MVLSALATTACNNGASSNVTPGVNALGFQLKGSSGWDGSADQIGQIGLAMDGVQSVWAKSKFAYFFPVDGAHDPFLGDSLIPDGATFVSGNSEFSEYDNVAKLTTNTDYISEKMGTVKKEASYADVPYVGIALSVLGSALSSTNWSDLNEKNSQDIKMTLFASGANYRSLTSLINKCRTDMQEANDCVSEHIQATFKTPADFVSKAGGMIGVLGVERKMMFGEMRLHFNSQNARKEFEKNLPFKLDSLNSLSDPLFKNLSETAQKTNTNATLSTSYKIYAGNEKLDSNSLLLGEENSGSSTLDPAGLSTLLNELQSKADGLKDYSLMKSRYANMYFTRNNKENFVARPFCDDKSYPANGSVSCMTLAGGTSDGARGWNEYIESANKILKSRITAADNFMKANESGIESIVTVWANYSKMYETLNLQQLQDQLNLSDDGYKTFISGKQEYKDFMTMYNKIMQRQEVNPYAVIRDCFYSDRTIAKCDKTYKTVLTQAQDAKNKYDNLLNALKDYKVFIASSLTKLDYKTNRYTKMDDSRLSSVICNAENKCQAENIADNLINFDSNQNKLSLQFAGGAEGRKFTLPLLEQTVVNSRVVTTLRNLYLGTLSSFYVPEYWNYNDYYVRNLGYYTGLYTKLSNNTYSDELTSELGVDAATYFPANKDCTAPAGLYFTPVANSNEYVLNGSICHILKNNGLPPVATKAVWEENEIGKYLVVTDENHDSGSLIYNQSILKSGYLLGGVEPLMTSRSGHLEDITLKNTNGMKFSRYAMSELLPAWQEGWILK